MAKSKYNKDFPLLAEGYAREGMRDKDIAKKLGISEDSFYQYKKKYPEFSESLKRGKAPVDTEVENALLKRAKGYSYEEIHQDVVDTGKRDENNNPILKIKAIKKIKKQIAPDVTAQIFWLKNRKRKKWRDKQDHELSGPDGAPLILNLGEKEKKL